MSELNSNPISIRLAEFEDASIIAEYTRRIASETENVTLDLETVLSGVRNAMHQTQYGFYVVAQSAGEVIACLMVTYEWSDWRNGLQWWLQSVYVHPAYRGLGVFKKLFSFVVELAKDEHNVCGIRLYVDKSNAIAISTYQALEMTPTQYLVYELDLRD